MKNKINFKLLIFSTPILFCLTTSCGYGISMDKPMYKYELMPRALPSLNGKQGIAMDNAFFYVSDNNKLIKYDKNWNLIKEIDNVSDYFTQVDGTHHIGDIEVYDNLIFTVGENFSGSVGTAIELGIFNTDLQ